MHAPSQGSEHSIHFMRFSFRSLVRFDGSGDACARKGRGAGAGVASVRAASCVFMGRAACF
eukprot:6205364-Pleurochrysis_carterae.AAC.2